MEPPRIGAFLSVPATLLLAVAAMAGSLPERPQTSGRTPGQHAADLLARFRSGPMAGISEIVFAVRPVLCEHWYANFGYYSDTRLTRTHFPRNALKGKRVAYLEGGRLCRLNLVTGGLKVLLDDRQGGVRDPVVHYDAKRILFSYRPGGSEYYHLYEINCDGSALRRLTDGPFDDIEPTYLPDGGILFVSSRCKRWVNCWVTQVAVLHRADGDGRNIRPLSSNNEHDNTPWVLPSGQILYTRWEYVDRCQTAFHHLWTANPDGTRQAVFFGNLHPGTVMIDAKPIPGSAKVVASFSPGHGRPEHAGELTVVDPRRGPDDLGSARAIRGAVEVHDPWAFSEGAFMAAHEAQIILLDGSGRRQVVYELPAADRQAGLQCHEPRPLLRRTREPLLPSRTDWSRQSGRLLLADVYRGRNMAGVRPGDIKKLLVLETLPKPINFTGGMEPLSFGGTFTLERVLGTVPVEPDGSAYFEAPALRSLFFVALDKNDLSVKRMQSFTTVMPSEMIACTGCHEQRVLSPEYRPERLLALHRRASRIEPVAGVPDILDYPRDVQPILDRHCVECHRPERREGGVLLMGDHGPVYSISYYTLTARGLVADGRNAAGNHPPRTIGTSASRLLGYFDGSHHDARPSRQEQTIVRLWIETGAAYPGTYAALGCGMVGGWAENKLDRSDTKEAGTVAAMDALRRRCCQCHQGSRALPLSATDEIGCAPLGRILPW